MNDMDYNNIELLRQFSNCMEEIVARGGLRDVLKRARQERKAVVVGFGSSPATPPDEGGGDAG